MKINSLSRQNFCAKPCRQTKELLYEMEENNINTKPITDVMNRIYVGDSVHTSIAPEGNIVVSIYHKKGDLIKNLIKLQDDLTVDTETLKLKNPKLIQTQMRDT